MKKEISHKLVSLVFSTLVICFAIAFYATGYWSEPTSNPPDGNADTPINTGSTTQSKQGSLSLNIDGEGNPINASGLVIGGDTYISNDLEVGGNIIGGGIEADSLTLNGQTKTDWSEMEADLQYGLYGSVEVRSESWPFYAATCQASKPGFCYVSSLGGYYGLTPIYAPLCANGFTLTKTGEYTQFQSMYTITNYSCYKSTSGGYPIGCGNGKVETGEVCDDGNTSNTQGNCSSDCSRVNRFDNPMKQLSGYWYCVYPYSNTSPNKYCQEQGFSSASKTLGGGDYMYGTVGWNGASWYVMPNEISRAVYIWCQ